LGENSPNLVTLFVAKKVSAAIVESFLKQSFISAAGLNGGHPVAALFSLIGEFPAFVVAWIDVVGQIAAISACGSVEKNISLFR
jgi:hypothetical protein